MLGISLGKVNYCVRALVDRGWMKITNFGGSSHPAVYFYKLTPKGFREKVNAARRFLDHKLEEHERLTHEIEILRNELQISGDRQKG